MDDAERRELWTAELEALEAIYGERGDDDDAANCNGGGDRARPCSTSTSTSSILTVLSRCPPSVRALLHPRGASSSASRFVRAELVLECSKEYPSAGERRDAGEGEEKPLVAASLSAPKGLGDKRRASLLSRVRAALVEVSASGELCVLGSLIEAALEAITEVNAPEGDCAICLSSLLAPSPSPSSSSSGGAEGAAEGGGANENGPADANRLVKLGECFHCLHLSCAARWWGATRRRRKKDKEKDEEGISSGDGNGQKEREGEREREEESLLLRCPQCREVAEVSPGAAARLDALARALEEEESAAASPFPAAAAATAAAADALSEGSPPPSVPVSCWGLGPSELERLREEQARRREGVGRQAARGALVAERWSVSLSELSLASSSSSSASASGGARPREEEAGGRSAGGEQQQGGARPAPAAAAAAAAGSKGQQQRRRGRGRGGRRGGGGGRGWSGGGGRGREGKAPP